MTTDMIVVRVYLTEGERLLKKILSLLHDEHKLSGVTVFRGIAGFGRSGEMHSSNLLDLSLDLPLAVEFYDQPGKIMQVLSDLRKLVDEEHIIFWPAQVLHSME